MSPQDGPLPGAWPTTGTVAQGERPVPQVQVGLVTFVTPGVQGRLFAASTVALRVSHEPGSPEVKLEQVDRSAV